MGLFQLKLWNLRTDFVSCFIFHSHGLPSSSVQSYRINIAENTMTMTRKTRYNAPPLRSNIFSIILLFTLRFHQFQILNSKISRTCFLIFSIIKLFNQTVYSKFKVHKHFSSKRLGFEELSNWLQKIFRRVAQ